MQKEERHDRPGISVIIPTLNEVESIDATLLVLSRTRGIEEIIVVDGGSRDDTARRVARHDVRLLSAPCGRGTQMHAGARIARGSVLWFLHADTLPPPDAAAHIEIAVADPSTAGGNFEIRFSGDFAAARLLTWLYRHLALVGLRYGDSGYFVRRTAYFAVGGFRDYPIFEDLDLLRRLRRHGRFVRLPATVTTSSRRFAGRYFTITFAHWSILQVLYWLGVSPLVLGRMYRHIRTPVRRGAAGAVSRHVAADESAPLNASR